MTRTVTFGCPYCPNIAHAGVTVVDHRWECPETGKTVFFDARYRPIGPDEPAEDLNALLADVLAEDRARRELRVSLVSFAFGIAVGGLAAGIAWLLLLG